jgi:hypothetical protein
MGPYCDCNECWWCLEHGQGKPWPEYPADPKESTMQKFDFDEWADLYRKDPAEFERKRKQMLDDAILAAPVDQRNKLRLLQMQCDGIRNSMPPLEATHEMVQMLGKKAKELIGPITSLREILEDAVTGNK